MHPGGYAGWVGLALVVAPWGFVIANASYAWMIRNGGSDSTGAKALALAATGPDLLRSALPEFRRRYCVVR